MSRHPREALFDQGRPLPILASCDHYAGRERFILKALAIQASEKATFDVTMDLEDGAAEGDEDEHRTMVIDLLRSTNNTKHRAGVRVHDPTHLAFRADVEQVVDGAAPVLTHLTLPKVGSYDDVVKAVEFIDGRTRSTTRSDLIPLHILIETHGALEDAFRIAAHPRVSVLDFGLMDFVSAHHGAIHRDMMRSPGQFDHPLIRRAKTRIAAAALAHGAVPAHNVTIDIGDTERVRSDARRAHHEFGFLRMWSVHPNQIVPIIEAMRPSFDDAAHAAHVLLAAQRANWGAIELDGTLYDRASYRFEWTLLSRAQLSGITIPEEADAAFFAPEG